MRYSAINIKKNRLNHNGDMIAFWETNKNISYSKRTTYGTKSRKTANWVIKKST